MPLTESLVDPVVEIAPAAPVHTHLHGGRAKCLQRLVRLDLPVPRTVALSYEAVRALATGQMLDVAALAQRFGAQPLLSVRPSSQDPDWGGPGAVLNIGMNDAQHAALAARLGQDAADVLYLRFIHSYAVDIARLDPDAFEPVDHPGEADIRAALAAFEAEMDEPFPQDPAVQLRDVLSSMARAWEGTTARLLREAKGAPADAGLGLVVQEMVLGVGPGESGSGVIQFVDATSGAPQITGRYLSQSQGRDALADPTGAIYLRSDPRGTSLEDEEPEMFAQLVAAGALCRQRLREEMQIEFVVENGHLAILDAVRVPRGARADVAVAVALARDEIISRDEAIMRIPPRALAQVLHRQVDPRGRRDVLAQGIGASPGAATGALVFTSRAAQASAARGEPCILARKETSPEDIRGMHSAAGVLTERGGMSSHAAVIARGLGVPCVAGASLSIDTRAHTVRTPQGRDLREGDIITLDGTSGAVLAGAAQLLEPDLGDAFQALLSWADARRDMGVRANADTPAEARVARQFAAEGIGLCRTEHMFFEDDRLTLVREMIFADAPEDRADSLSRLLPLQRNDFSEIFEIMRGHPVCIRLFDPPLHEFLPHTREAQKELADALSLPLSRITRRTEALSEYNPMLGMRGVRLGVVMPEIYQMQARAILEAALAFGDIVPEIMIPLVTTKREVEIVRTAIEAVAGALRAETGRDVAFRLGVMVETPRAALRAGDIAPSVSFMSFGTNDLTQMTYGLSRDDAGRFMSAYVQQGIFPEDPFHHLDEEGVGELLELAANRARHAADVTLSVCGEHGGHPESIRFIRAAGYNYVSCSPFRVPLARLTAAQLAIEAEVAESCQ